MNRVGTQKKILDAAELLFALNGYHATSLRAITAKAGVNLAAVNYHFGSKKSLLDNVIERRIVPLNAVRIEMLESVRSQAKEQGQRPSVRNLMHAFVAPTITFRDSGEGARNFIALVGRVLSEPQSTVHRSFFRFMEPFITVMLASLKEALPALSKAGIGGAAAKSAKSAGAKAKGKKSAKAIPTGWLIDEVVRFVTAGMEA
jgi:AcrR family transcriptional regulator